MNKEKTLTVSRVFAWVFGILFLLAGFGNITSNILGGILFILASLFILPPAYDLIKSKTKLNLSKGLRILIALILLTIAGSLLGANAPERSIEEDSVNVEVKDEMVTEEKTEESSTTEKPAEAKPTTVKSETPKQEQTSTVTLGEKQALSSAKKYLGYTAFSKKGLVKQLEFEGFSNQEATYAVDNINADWNTQAAISAKKYLEYTSFSRSGLIEQLEFEGYTRQQAEYGATAVGY